MKQVINDFKDGFAALWRDMRPGWRWMYPVMAMGWLLIIAIALLMFCAGFMFKADK
jgi:hypothetical protein